MEICLAKTKKPQQLQSRERQLTIFSLGKGQFLGDITVYKHCSRYLNV